jgi:hypothetical protein
MRDALAYWPVKAPEQILATKERRVLSNACNQTCYQARSQVARRNILPAVWVDWSSERYFTTDNQIMSEVFLTKQEYASTHI